jgi:hypothetical protein
MPHRGATTMHILQLAYRFATLPWRLRIVVRSGALHANSKCDTCRAREDSSVTRSLYAGAFS